jgi:hypothetical protein
VANSSKDSRIDLSGRRSVVERLACLGRPWREPQTKESIRMKPSDVSTFAASAAIFAAAGIALGASSGCLCPPCAAGPTTAATAGTTVAATTAAPAMAASSPVTGGSREVIWDGDNVAKGQSWASCDKEGACKATLAPAPGEGAAGSSGLKLHGEGSGWQGGGWNWFGWYPENAGTDLSGYDDLKFSVKVTSAAKDKAPTAGGISLAFGCSKDKKTSADASLGKYAANAADGQWHEVSIPLKDFFDGKGAECDSRTAWEFRVSSWSGTPVSFDIVIDDVAVAKK